MLLSRIKNVLSFSSHGTAGNILKALRWIRKQIIPQKGVCISNLKRHPYPEVTGYLIPSLIQWGEKALALDLMRWLLRQQNEDGSFCAVDGTPYTFDTGQVMRGMVATLGLDPLVREPLRRACDWILTQVQPDGRLGTPSTKLWSNITDDRIHLYVLPPLIQAGHLLNEPTYKDAAQHVLNHYKQRDNLIQFDTLSHFYAYTIEALCDLGEKALAAEAMQRHIIPQQRRDGSVPAYADKPWICSVGLAQLAVIGYKLGLKEFADKALERVRRAQRLSGGFYGSWGPGAGYFCGEEISWAVKYFLDASLWQIKASFNEKADSFPDTITEEDGRVQAVLSFLGDLNGKHILDVGCGKGRFLHILEKKYPRVRLYGVDFSEEMLRRAPQETEIRMGSILDVPYPDNSFDGAYCVEALEHAVHIDNAIRELCRVVKPGGKMLIIDKNVRHRGRLTIEPWEQWFDAKQILRLLKNNGIHATHRFIAHDKKGGDGLFIAWEGIKHA